jgi:S-adenosylmethionine-dependent methyltransferase
MHKPATSDNRFDSDAGRYAAYLETPEGRLRAELAFLGLQDALPGASLNETLRALDVGCGTGATAIRLAHLGIHVTLLDSSSSMLELAQRAADESGVGDRISLQSGDVSELAQYFHAHAFDIIVCHNVLEFIEDPHTVLRSIARLMKPASAMLSLLVRNQAGEVLKAALQSGDLLTAENNLSAEWGQESLYQGRVRFFTPEALEALLEEASLEVDERRGVRIVSDYLPSNISRSAEYERILSLERKLANRSEFFAMARYLHYLVRSGAPGPDGPA